MIRFAPSYHPAPWGGRAFEDLFDRADLPPGPIGESWELVALDGEMSLASDGRSLAELWGAGALGGSARGEFPFLLKWIHATDFLSVQVHPDESVVARLGHGAPKTEAWFVAHADEGSSILAGHYPGFDGATLKLAAEGGTVRKWLYELRPRQGDYLLISSGTLHSIGPGVVLLEVQQPSTTTFRVYDWDRPGLDGAPRALHLEEAAESVHFERHGPPRARRDGVVGPCFSARTLAEGEHIAPGPLRVFAAGMGPVGLRTSNGEEHLAMGDVVVAEPDDGDVKVSGPVVLLGEATDLS